jgi:hypothetical protein
MIKPKKSLTPEEIAAVREGLMQIQRDLREVIAFLQARLGEKPA